MIFTVTMNPSLDYIMRVPKLLPGSLNRSSGESLYPGGKGVNVSIMLSRLGIDSVMTGFTAGLTGGTFEAMLTGYGLSHDFIRLPEGNTRINVKIKSSEEKESEINGLGPDIPLCCFEALLKKLECIKTGDILVVSGTAPPSLTDDFYERLLGLASDAGALVFVDISGRALKDVLKSRPFLIKPNRDELSEISGCRLDSIDDIILAAKSALELGAENVLVSLDCDGAVLVCGDGRIIMQAAPEGKVVNSVGAGDSLLAGFIAGMSKTGDLEEALKLGVAAGSASAFSEWLAEPGEILCLLGGSALYDL